MALNSLTIDELYDEIRDLAQDQGVTTRDVWDDVVEEVVEGHVDLGEIDSDEDTEGMKEILRAKWGTYKEEMAEDEEQDEYEADTISMDTADDDDEDEDDDEEDERDGYGSMDDDNY